MIDWLTRAEGALGYLTLNSIDGENRMTPDDVRSAAVLVGALAEDPAVRALVITSASGHFSLGWAAGTGVRGFETESGEVTIDPFGFLAQLPIPVICGISGDCFSAGLELALACDLRIAATGARFALPETAHGLIPLAGGTQRLPRLVGRGRAADLILLGTTIDARTALDWGLVNRVAEPAELDSALAETAGIIARRGPIAERFAKEAIREGVEMPLARALRYELDLTVILQTTADRAEGVQAFAEKRPPRFTGE